MLSYAVKYEVLCSVCVSFRQDCTVLSLLQCREHLMNVVIPREDHTLKVSGLPAPGCGQPSHTVITFRGVQYTVGQV